MALFIRHIVRAACCVCVMMCVYVKYEDVPQSTPPAATLHDARECNHMYDPALQGPRWQRQR